MWAPEAPREVWHLRRAAPKPQASRRPPGTGAFRPADLLGPQPPFHLEVGRPCPKWVGAE
eukprot:8884986-Alexandrium_andersonii.AAC.1